MKLKILSENYFSYLLIFGGMSIFSYYYLKQDVSYGTFFILILLWLTDLLFERKKYLTDIEINEKYFKITYLNNFLIKKKYIKEIDSIEFIDYKKSDSFINKFDLLIINEKDALEIITFKISEKETMENVKNVVSNFKKI